MSVPKNPPSIITAKPDDFILGRIKLLLGYVLASGLITASFIRKPSAYFKREKK